MSSAALATYLEAHVSERMRRIVDFALDGRATWDLCCDHGLIGLWAWLSLDLPEIHFVDRAPGLIADLEQRIGRQLENDRMFFHARDASKISFGEQACNLFLTGVGFRASQRILAGIDPRITPHRVIVSVHAEAEKLPRAMQELGWRFAGATTLEEQGRVRTIFAWDGGY